MTQPVRLAATDQVRGSTSSIRRRRPVAAFAGAVALLAAGGAAATFLIGGDQTRAAATDAPQIALAAAAQQLPVRTVKTISIKVDPTPNTTKTGLKPAPQPPASNAANASAIDPLPPEDPRWAHANDGRAGKSGSSAPNALAALNTPAGAIVLGALAAREEPSDPISTAAIFWNKEQAVEKTLAATPPELTIPAPELPVTEEKPAAEERPAPQQTVRVNDGVNLRAKGASGSRVLRTIPANASVGLVGCKDWCEVVYDGTRGFIYKSFIGGKRAAAQRAARAGEQALPGVSTGKAIEKTAAAAADTPSAAATTAENAAEAKASDWPEVRER